MWFGHHFQGQRSKVKVTCPLSSLPCWRVRQLQRWAWERGGREKLLLRCRLLGPARPFGAHGGGEGRGHIVAAARLQLVLLYSAAMQFKQAVREAAVICLAPLQVDLWSFDLESGIRVTCDVRYLCANFSVLRPLCSRLRPDVRDRQTSSDTHHRLMHPPYGCG